MTASGLRIDLLGELTVRRGPEATVVKLPQSKKTRALLGYLIVTGRPQRRTRLCSLFWDVADDPRGALRWCLSKIRPIVDEPGRKRIVTDGDSVSFDASDTVIDLFRSREAIASGADGASTETLLEIAASYRGELLEGLEMSDFDEFQAWCLAERSEARNVRSGVLRELCSRLSAEPEKALPHARNLIRIAPVDESARTQLIDFLLRANRRDEAEQQLDVSVRQLREFGVEPSRALTDSLRAPAVSVAAPIAAKVVVPRDTALVGRREERAALLSVLDGVRSTEMLRAVLISGEPGVGKSRVWQELLDEVGAQGGITAVGCAYEAERGRPFGPWIDALRALPMIAELGEDTALSALLPELEGENQASPTGEQIFAAVVDFMIALSEHTAPVALAFDDVHWLDAASVELLHFAARRLRERPILFAMTARSGEIADNEPVLLALRSLRKERVIEEVELGPMAPDDCVALIAASAPEVDAKELCEQSGGNPLFALELARSGAAGSRSQTITDVVRERIERLGPDSGDVLRWAAALDPSASVSRIGALTALSGEAYVAAIEQLEERALLATSGDSLSFAHGIVRSVVYGEISQPRRQLMHGKIARSMDLSTEGDETIAAELAHHAHLAGEAATAARACIAAGGRSLRLFANQDAMALCRRGFRYTEELPEPERTVLEIDLWSIKFGAAVPEDYEEAANTLEALGGRALDAGFEKSARRAYRMLGYIRWERGQTIDAARHMLNAARLTEGTGGVERASALADAARCLVRLDRELGHAEALTLEAKAIAEHHAERSPMLADAEGMLRAHEGAVDRAAEYFSESAALARAGQKRLLEFEALENTVTLFLRYGLPERAQPLRARLLELGERMREGSEGPTARAFAAAVTYCDDGGDRDAVIAALDELRIVDAKQRMATVLLATAQRDIEDGDPDAALPLASEALEFSKILRHKSLIAWARVITARAALATGQTELATAMRAALSADGTTDLAAFAKKAVLAVI